VGRGQLRDEVQPQPTEGGVPADGRNRRLVPGGVADLHQPAGSDDRDHDPHRAPAVPQPVAHEFLEGQQQPVHVVVGGARRAAPGDGGAQLHPQGTHLGEGGGSAVQDLLHRGRRNRARPLRPGRLDHEPSSGSGAGRTGHVSFREQGSAAVPRGLPPDVA
jgi:hypothetical protein